MSHDENTGMPAGEKDKGNMAVDGIAGRIPAGSSPSGKDNTGSKATGGNPAESKPAGNNKRTGKTGEMLAARHLESLGFRLVARNLRIGRLGELDLVSWAEDGCTLCFIEVKTRTSDAFGTPAEAVTYRKRQRIRKMAEVWMGSQRMVAGSFADNLSVRFDVVEVMLERETRQARVHHIPDAF